MGERTGCRLFRATLTGPTCRYPTPRGLCRRPVPTSGERCYQHVGLDAVAAATSIAVAIRRRKTTAARQPKSGAKQPDQQPPMSDAQIAAVAGCLNRHGVAYVLVGGAASQLHGAPVPRTRDADVVPSRDGANLDRLAVALREMEARLWAGPTEPGGLRMVFDRMTLGRIEGFLNLVTRHGPVDITYRPQGTDGYTDLVRSAVVIRLMDVDVPVAALEDVIRSKEAAGRAKDLAVLPELVRHLRRSH